MTKYELAVEEALMRFADPGGDIAIGNDDFIRAVAAALEAAHADGAADDYGRSVGLEQATLPILRGEVTA